MTFKALSVAVVALFPLWMAGVPVPGPGHGEAHAAKPARTLVIEFAGVFADCKCKASVTGSTTDVKIKLCPNGNHQYAQIKINSDAPYSPPCNCETKEGQDCTGKVTAELVIPDSCLSGVWQVEGPGIGTTGTPCEDVVNGGEYEATWNLSATCNEAAGNTGVGQEMVVKDQPCGSATPGNIVLRYKPVLSCGMCKEQ